MGRLAALDGLTDRGENSVTIPSEPNALLSQVEHSERDQFDNCTIVTPDGRS